MATQTVNLGSQANAKGTQNFRALAVISSLFFFFGFLTCMNDILVPHLKRHFDLNYTQAMLVQFSFFTAYFVASIPSSRFCEKYSYQKGMWVGLLIASLGTLGLWASAFSSNYEIFLLALFVLACGITLIQVAANPYVTLLGRPESSSTRLVLVQALNSVGTTIAPMVGASLILSQTSIEAIQPPYLVMTAALVLAAVFVLSIKLPLFHTAASDTGVPWKELFANRKLMMGCLGIFAYVGAEVAIGSVLVNWLSQSVGSGITEETAGRYVSYYWGGAMVGRFLGGALLAMNFKPRSALLFVTTGALVLVLTTLFGSSEMTAWAVVGVGLFNSIMFPTIFSQSILGLKRGAEKASGLLCTSIVGGALVPVIMGRVADMSSLQWAFIVPAVCYVYILYFAKSLNSKT